MKTIHNVRRPFKKAVIVATAALASTAGLAACGSDSGAEGSQTLVVASFGGSFDEAQTKVVVAEFEKRYDAKVKLVVAQGNQALTKLKTQGAKSGFDVVQFSGGQETEAARLGLIAPIDPKLMPNAAKVVDQAKRNGGEYPPAYAFNTTGILYNTEKVKTAPTSWDDLGDPKYKGRVGLPDISVTAGLNLLLSLAHMNGGDENNVDPGFTALKKIVPDAYTVYRDGPTMTQLFAQNQIVMGVFDSGYGYLLNKQQGLPVKFSIPSEGAVLYGLVADVVKGSKQAKLAQQFVDLMLDPEIQVAFAKEAGYTPTSSEAELPADLAEALPIQSALDRMFTTDPEVVNAGRPKWTEEWNQVVAK